MTRALKSLVAVAALGSALLVLGASQAAAQPCWRAVILDWSHDHQIQGNYPIQCYRDALSNAPEDLQMYSDLPASLTRAMQRALQRNEATSNSRVPQGVKHARKVVSRGDSKPKTATSPIRRALDAIGPTEARSIPIPMIVLAGIALLLVATGVAGMVAKRLQARRVPRDPPSA
jgi:hypothetical protein